MSKNEKELLANKLFEKTDKLDLKKIVKDGELILVKKRYFGKDKIYAQRINFKKDLKELYYAIEGQINIIDVPERKFVIITGKGNRDNLEYHSRISKIYAVAYILKDEMKSEARDFVMPPLEFFCDTKNNWEDIDNWRWKLAIPIPIFITNSDLMNAIQIAKEEKGLVNLTEISLEIINENLSAQTLHLGSYKNVNQTLNYLLDQIKRKEYKLNGFYHEIYLNNPKKTKETKLKTLIRYPIKK
jgi:hypothetical protein